MQVRFLRYLPFLQKWREIGFISSNGHFTSFQLAASVIIFQPILNLLTQCISNIRWEHVIDTNVPFAPPLNVVVGDEENCWHMSSGHFSHLVFYTRTHLLFRALINHKLVIRYTRNQNRYVITYMFTYVKVPF